MSGPPPQPDPAGPRPAEPALCVGPDTAEPACSAGPDVTEPEPTTADPDTSGSSAIDPEVQAFQDVCTRLAGFDERIDPEWADGYLTAVAASWRVIPREEWLPRLVQDDAFERTFADPTDHDQAVSALDAHLGLLRRALDPGALLDEPDALRLAPLMQVWDDEARAEVVREGHATDEEAQTLLTGGRWAEGFFAALEDFEADWPTPEDDAERAELFEGLLQSVAALAWDPASPEFRDYAAAGWKDASPSRDELIDEAAFAVQDLRVYWLDHAPRHAPRRVEVTPGRNDPCPCGSGRKWKRCHGA